jgi:deoxyadenosine/deoxycytidine kinase
MDSAPNDRIAFCTKATGPRVDFVAVSLYVGVIAVFETLCPFPRMPDPTDASSPKKHVAISGNIGAGKSSLTDVMGDYFDWNTVYEQVDENPYLTDFYNDMRRWSFNLQVFFLSRRFEQLQKIEQMDQSVVQDRSIYEDAQIFARNLYEMGLMSGRDYQNYNELFSIMTSYLDPPSLLVYLRASVPTLVNHIQQRGREYESTIRIDYLERLQGHYEDWISDYDRGPKLIIDVDELDFVNEEDDRRAVLNQIESRLFGLFPDE